MPTPWEEGNPNASICILGEAPGKVEMQAKRPFVGPAGRLFDICLNHAQVARGECYILNVFPFEVHRKGSDTYDRDGRCLVKAGWLTEAGREAADSAFDKLLGCASNVIVPMGATALCALSDKNQIMKWRGSIIAGRGGRKLVPTIHPAASLRGQYLWRYLIINDLKKAKAEAASPRLDLPKRQLFTPGTLGECLEAFDYLRNKQKPVATDIEVINHQVACFSVSNNPLGAMSVPLTGPDGHVWSAEDEHAIWTAYAELCADPNVMKIGQNVSFDMSVLWQKNRIVFNGPIGDTMVANSIMYPEFLKGLDLIASLNTREPYWKDDGKLWRNPQDSGAADWDQFYEYNARDSAVTLECWQVLEHEMAEKGFRETHDETVRMYGPFLYMMSHGMRVNETELFQVKRNIKSTLQDLYTELYKVADYEFNPGSPKQCQEYFYKHKGISPYTSRKTGRPTTDDLALSRILRRFNLREAKLVQDIRNLEKLEGTYLEIRYDSDKRLRCSYNPRGTWTGRPSSSKTVFGTGTNMQNLDPRFKSFLAAG